MAFLVCLGVAILIKVDGRVVWVHDGECDLISLHKEREVDGAFLFGHGSGGLDGIFEKVRKYVGERAFDGGKALREGDLVAGADGEFFKRHHYVRRTSSAPDSFLSRVPYYY